MNQIKSKRSISADFSPIWEFNGIIDEFNKPLLDDESRDNAEQIIKALTRLLEEK